MDFSFPESRSLTLRPIRIRFVTIAFRIRVKNVLFEQDGFQSLPVTYPYSSDLLISNHSSNACFSYLKLISWLDANASSSPLKQDSNTKPAFFFEIRVEGSFSPFGIFITKWTFSLISSSGISTDGEDESLSSPKKHYLSSLSLRIFSWYSSIFPFDTSAEKAFREEFDYLWDI